MTRPRKLLLWLIVLPVLLVALIVGLAFLPAVQTFVVHRALASRPEIKAEVQEVAVSLGGARLRGLRYEQPGITVTAPSFEADVPLLDLVGKKIDLRRLVLRDVAVVVDLGALPASSPDAKKSEPFVGLLKSLVLPPSLRVEGVDLAGTIRVNGANPIDASFTLLGGGLASGAEGTVTLTLKAAASRGKLATELKLRPTLGADGQLTALSAVLDATAESAELASPAKLKTEISIARSGDGETYRLRVAAGAAPLVELTSSWAPGATQPPGHWLLAVTDADLKPFLLGTALPSFRAKGEGELTAAAADRFRVGGQLNVAADSLERVAGVPALGPVKIDLRFGLEMNAGVPRVETLSFTLAGATPVLSVDVRQPFGFDAAARKVLPSRPGADLCDIVVLGLPVAWLKPYLPTGVTVGGPITGAWVVRADDGGFVAAASAPLVVPGVRVDSATAQSQFVFDALRVEGSRARFGAAGLTAGFDKLRLQAKGEDVVTVSGEAVLKPGAPITAKGDIVAALKALTAQPALAGASRLSGGLATVNFTVSQGDTLSANARVTLAGLRAGSTGELPEVALNADVTRRADGGLTLKVPVTVQNKVPARSSDLLLVATIVPKAGGMQIASQLTGKLLYAADLQIFSALAPPAPSAATPATPAPAPVPDKQPLWAGYGGDVNIALDRVVYQPGIEVTAIDVKVAITPDTLSMSGLKAAISGGTIALNGALKFAGPGAGYVLDAGAVVRDLQTGPLLKALSAKQNSQLDGTFSLDANFKGKGSDPAAAGRAATGDITISGKNGVIRALNLDTNKYARAGSAVAGLAGLAGALSGNSELSRRAGQVSALNSVARLLGQLQFDEIKLSATRGTDGELDIGNFNLSSAQLSANGSGAVANAAGKSVWDQALKLSFKVGARGDVSDNLRTLGLLAAPAADAAPTDYIPLTEPLDFDGSLREVGTKQVTRLLSRAIGL